MTSKDLKNRLQTPIFTTQQLEKLFPNENKSTINIQLSRMEKRGDLVRVKRGLYVTPEYFHHNLNEFVLAQELYSPSYVSLESALSYYGLIPEDVPNVTSVTPITTKKIKTPVGTFFYSKIKKELYLKGAVITIGDAASLLYLDIAMAEKAILDYVYIRRIKSLSEMRLDRMALEDHVDRLLFREWAERYPAWVQDVVKELYE